MPHLFAVLVLRKGRNFPHKLGRANLGMRSGGGRVPSLRSGCKSKWCREGDSNPHEPFKPCGF
jgi:hypothetical protein